MTTESTTAQISTVSTTDSQEFSRSITIHHTSSVSSVEHTTASVISITKLPQSEYLYSDYTYIVIIIQKVERVSNSYIVILIILLGVKQSILFPISTTATTNTHSLLSSDQQCHLIFWAVAPTPISQATARLVFTSCGNFSQFWVNIIGQNMVPLLSRLATQRD